jgi:predicted RNase H-like nuclease (RuvC/YqgF family)
MDATIINTLIGFAGVVVGIIANSLIQYIGKRMEAKKIEVDIASEIIEQYKSLFEPYKEEVKTLREINKELKADNEKLKKIIKQLEIKIDELTIALEKCNTCLMKFGKEKEVV